MEGFFLCFLGTFRTMGTAVQCLRIPRRNSDPNLYTCFCMVRALEKKKIINSIVACALEVCKLQRTSRNIWSRIYYRIHFVPALGEAQNLPWKQNKLFFFSREIVGCAICPMEVIVFLNKWHARTQQQPTKDEIIYLFCSGNTSVSRLRSIHLLVF